MTNLMTTFLSAALTIVLPVLAALGLMALPARRISRRRQVRYVEIPEMMRCLNRRAPF